MTEDFLSKRKDEEYKLNDNEGAGKSSQSYMEVSPRQPAKGIIPPKKKMMIPILVVVVIFVTYNVFSPILFPKKKNKFGDVAELNSNAANKKLLPKKVAVEPAVPTNKLGIYSQQGNINKNWDKQMSNVVDKTAENGNKIEELKNGLSKTASDISRLENKLDDLDSKIEDVVKKLSNAANKAKSQKARKLSNAAKDKAAAAAVKKNAMIKKISYHVKAIVAGMAWLETDDGQTLVVKVGDKINDDYGIVKMISPEKGVVIASNGYVIQYDGL